MKDKDLIDLAALELVTDADLARALLVVRSEILRRGVRDCDPAALVSEAFERGFLESGLPKDPWIEGGILVAPGAKIDRSAMSHRCAFVRIGTHWVWEHPDLVDDSVRYLPGPQQRMQSVSLVPLADGDQIDLVQARTRSGVHELVGVRSFSVEDGSLVLVSARAVGKVSHR